MISGLGEVGSDEQNLDLVVPHQGRKTRHQFRWHGWLCLIIHSATSSVDKIFQFFKGNLYSHFFYADGPQAPKKLSSRAPLVTICRGLPENVYKEPGLFSRAHMANDSWLASLLDGLSLILVFIRPSSLQSQVKAWPGCFQVCSCS